MGTAEDSHMLHPPAAVGKGLLSHTTENTGMLLFDEQGCPMYTYMSKGSMVYRRESRP